MNKRFELSSSFRCDQIHSSDGGTTTLIITTLSITPFSIMTLSIMGLFATLSITVLCAIMPSVAVLSVAIFYCYAGVVMLSVVVP